MARRALRDAKNAGFVRNFFAILDAADVPQYKTAMGGITPAGIERAVSAIVAKVYPGEVGERLITSITEEGGKEGMKAWGKAVLGSLPAMMKLETSIDLGRIDPSYGYAEDIALVTDRYGRYVIDQKMEPGDYLKQLNMLEVPLSPFQFELLKFIDVNIKSQKAMRGWIEAYISKVFELRDQLTQLQQIDMFGYKPAIN